MPRKFGKDSNFKGKKKRSGRYSVADEALKNRVKHKAWLKTDAEMDKNIAAQIVLKDMANKVEATGNINVEIISYDGDHKNSIQPLGEGQQLLRETPLGENKGAVEEAGKNVG